MSLDLEQLPDGTDLTAKLTLMSGQVVSVQVRIAQLIGDQVEPERKADEAGAFIYEAGKRPNDTFVIYILSKIVLEELARSSSKNWSSFHVHDNVNTPGSVICWPGRIENVEEAKMRLKQWLGLIGVLVESDKDDINQFYNDEDANWMDNVPQRAGVKVVISKVPEAGTFREPSEGDYSTDRNDNPDCREPFDANKLFTLEPVIRATRGVIRFLREDPKILYPASGTDISLEEVFPKRSITYLDPSEGVVTKLKEDNERNVVMEGIPTTEYRGTHDLVLSVNRNGGLEALDFLPYLNTGGIVLAYGHPWNFDALSFLLSEDYTLIGVMESGEEEFHQDNLVDYKEVTQVANPPKHTQFKRMGEWYIFRKK